jgi:hypothetical protein
MPKNKQNNGRDYLMVKIINGVTKAGVHKDKKKEENKKRARKKVTEDS